MATYEYDDYRVVLTPHGDGGYAVRALAADGSTWLGRFEVPLRHEELEREVLQLARAGHARRAGEPAAGTDGEPTRDVGGDGPPRLHAQRLGAALADALLAGDVGEGYRLALDAASSAGRGLRLSLSLAGAPALLDLPWEFMYRRPRFLASQRHSPLVRHLDTGSLAPPPSIETTVRMLGVVATPVDLGPLDVAAERRRVEQAVAKVVEMGRVELEWLEPATPRRLRQALRDDTFHIVHFVGHSSFSADGEGVLFLEREEDGRAEAVDGTALANLLSDQSNLRLVVLNSCEGARTTLGDPYAGVATTLIELGVPAVVAMQFEISDRAAIVFAEELYTNLIGRQDPIDAAMAEARKAVYIEVDKVEWATPVLFVRHPDVELFRFEVPAAPLPPQPPPGTDDDTVIGDTVGGDTVSDDTVRRAAVRGPAWRRGRRRGLVAAAGGLVLVAVGAGALLAITADDPEPPVDTVPAPQSIDEPRPPSGFLAMQVAELEGDTHLYVLNDEAEIDAVTTGPDVVDTQPVWDRRTNRLAFTRDWPDDDVGSRIWYVVPQHGTEHPGTEPAPLVDWQDDASTKAFPAWGPDGALWYTTRDDCEAGPGCTVELWRATFTATDDDPDRFTTEFTSLDVLVEESDDQITDVFDDVRAVAADPADPSRVAVVDAAGLHLVDIGSEPDLVRADPALTGVTFTADGQHLVATGGDGDRVVFHVLDRVGVGLQDNPIDELDPDGWLAESLGRPVPGVDVLSMTSVPPDEVDDVLVVLDDPGEDLSPVLVEFTVDDDGTMWLDTVHGTIEGLGLVGELQAIAL